MNCHRLNIERRKLGENMAKATKQTPKKGSFPIEPKNTGFFQKLFFWFFIPVLFALAVFLIIAQLTNINIFDGVKNLSSGLTDSKNETNEENPLVFEERVVTLQAQIQEKEAQIVDLQTQLDSSASEKELYLIEQERLLEEIELLKRQQDDTKRDFDEIISTFEQMSSKSAAPVITNMSDAEALRILTNMKPDILAGILEEITPVEAARYTELMSKQ